MMRMMTKKKTNGTIDGFMAVTKNVLKLKVYH